MRGVLLFSALSSLSHLRSTDVKSAPMGDAHPGSSSDMEINHPHRTQPPTQYSLIRGCSLFESDQRYILGNLNRVTSVTSAFQRTALKQLALGKDPLSELAEPVRSEVQRFIYQLDSAGFLNHQIATLAPPIRSNGANGAKSKELDLALNQLKARSTPELMQSEWIDGCADGGTSTVAARSQYVIELIGRSRTITLLYSLLLASGVSRIRFADRHLRPRVDDLDIGCGAIVASDLGGNYYEILESRRRELSLFPIERNQAIEPNLPPHLVIHAGEIDPELATQWSNQRQPYLLIHPAIGDEVLIGPLVKPGVSPCVRCLSLYERDNFAFTRTERIPLTAISDLPMITAHYVAAIAAAQVLHFIDSATSEVAHSHRNTGVGELTYINLQRLSEPQVVAIARHPLCGCDR